MARLPRLIIPTQPHHVLQSGNDGLLVFRDSEDHQQFLTWLKACARELKVAIHAYVLMPNHFHLLATPSTEQGLAQMMQRLGRLYVPWFNAKHQRSGTLFQGRFKTSLIEARHYFMLCSLYIEVNPVRSHLVSEAREYAWSSYAHHAGVRPDPIITDHASYWELGNTPFQREAAYIELARAGLTKAELVLVEAALLKGWPLGSDAFKAELQANSPVQVIPAKRGRPFKTPASEPPPRGQT